MALRALMLNKKIQEKKNELEELRKKAEGFTTREAELEAAIDEAKTCLLYTSPSPRDLSTSRMPSSA